MTQIVAAAAATTYLLCGCPDTAHVDGCALGQAEEIACAALDAPTTTTHPLITALTALLEAGLLRDRPGADLEPTLLGVVDDLWELRMIGPQATDAGAVPDAQS